MHCLVNLFIFPRHGKEILWATDALIKKKNMLRWGSQNMNDRPEAFARMQKELAGWQVGLLLGAFFGSQKAKCLG